MSGTGFIYPSDELEALAGARNYYRWIISRFEPYLGPRVVEVGAGIGTFSEYLLGVPGVERLTAIEPAANTFPLLEAKLAGNPRAHALKGFLDEFASQLSADSLVAVNVLEHVQKDEEFLRLAWRIVVPGGTLMLFVPAVPAIFGTLDTAFEHFRRYTRPGLGQTLEKTGWVIERMSYMNFPGIIPWLIAGRLLRWRSISPRSARFYDRFVMPPTARIEEMIEMPIGQSLLAIARKPAR
jgi:SAM-dependent methyltransferase